jgi:hypothetical protein
MTIHDADPPPPSDDELPAMTIAADSRYAIGLPILVAITLENRAQDTDFYGLPRLEPTTTRGPLHARWDNVAAATRIETRLAAAEEDGEGVALGPGESMQLLVDLSNMGTALPPGHHRLSLALVQGKLVRRSNVVEVELVALSAPDAAEASRLRKLGEAPLDSGAWAPFLTNNWTTVSSSLSPDATRPVALHLALHRAAYGPDAPGQLDPAPFMAITEPHLAAEVAALTHELALARNDPAAAQLHQQIATAWPGLAWRLQANEQGGGMIQDMRTSYGAEKQHLRPPAGVPYHPF